MAYNNDFGIGIVRVELNRMDRGKRRILKDTVAVFRDAVSFIIHVVCDHVDEVSGLDSLEGLTFVERLIHTTKDNGAEYPAFDKIFYKFPSYMRRSAIHAAIGHVMSHETRCTQYYDGREELVSRGIHYKKMEPSFTYTPVVEHKWEFGEPMTVRVLKEGGLTSGSHEIDLNVIVRTAYIPVPLDGHKTRTVVI